MSRLKGLRGPNQGSAIAIRYVKERDYIRRKKQFTTRDIADNFGLNIRQARRDLMALADVTPIYEDVKSRGKRTVWRLSHEKTVW